MLYAVVYASDAMDVKRPTTRIRVTLLYNKCTFNILNTIITIEHTSIFTPQISINNCQDNTTNQKLFTCYFSVTKCRPSNLARGKYYDGSPGSMGARRNLNFIKEYMTTNKMCSKFRFFKRFKIKISYLLLVLCFVQPVVF